MYVYLYNPSNNRARKIKWGVSWTYFFFGGLALLFSGRWLYIIIELVLLMLNVKQPVGAILISMYHLYLFLFGNKSYARHLISKGWKPSDEATSRLLGIPM